MLLAAIVRFPHAAAPDFAFPVFAVLLLLNGIGMGLFAAPNTTGIMNSVPAGQRAASGMRATFQNTGMVLSIGLFFSLMVVGLWALPDDAQRARANGVPPATAQHFPRAAGRQPVRRLPRLQPDGEALGPETLAALPPAEAADITGKEFFPELISDPFIDGLRITFTASLIMCLIAAWASWLRGGNPWRTTRTSRGRSALRRGGRAR